jgi:hypothetical protein
MIPTCPTCGYPLEPCGDVQGCPVFASCPCMGDNLLICRLRDYNRYMLAVLQSMWLVMPKRGPM